MAESVNGKVLVIPCSGIGKVHGLMAREATYRVVDDLEPGTSDTLCLALLVKGDEEAVEAVRTRPCITIDGCPKLCSFKNVQLAGGNIAESVRVVDAFKGHKGAQPGTATELAEDGWTITDEIAQQIAARVRELCGGEEQ
jgi:uncharacterized metal-binding protein